MAEEHDYWNQMYANACDAAGDNGRTRDVEWRASLERLRPFYLLRPRMFPDGNVWCALYGDNIQEGVCGFGDTPEKASIAFDLAWLNEKAQRIIAETLGEAP